MIQVENDRLYSAMVVHTGSALGFLLFQRTSGVRGKIDALSPEEGADLAALVIASSSPNFSSGSPAFGARDPD